MADYYVEKENAFMDRYRMEFMTVGATRGVTAHAHLHPAVELLYIREGVCRVLLDGATYTASVGDTVLCRSNVIHYIDTEQPVVYDVLKVHPSLILEIFSGESNLSLHFLTNRRHADCLFPADAAGAGNTCALWTQMHALYHSHTPLCLLKLRLCAAQLLLLLLECMPASGEPDRDGLHPAVLQQIDSAIRCLDEHFASPITPVECAEKLHMSYSYFARCFRLVTGKTFKQYLTDLRLVRAEFLLLSGTLPVTEVAPACGYENVSYFIREFRRHKGQTPHAFRRANMST